jgi:soluble lytic murein transglycosylase
MYIIIAFPRGIMRFRGVMMPVRLCLLAAALVLLPPQAFGRSLAPPDAAFREGWDLLVREVYPDARAALGRIDPGRYDLGDYVLYLTGLSLSRDGRSAEAGATFDRLAREFPGSPLIAFLAHELAYTAARKKDLETMARYLATSRGKVGGNGRKAEEGYMAALLLEGAAPDAAAARAHLENFVSYPAHEGAIFSMERIWTWRSDGTLKTWRLPVMFYGRYAKALARAAEGERAVAVYEEALAAFPHGDDYYSVLIDYAELLRKQGSTARSKRILLKAHDNVIPAPLRHEMEFLEGRVDWKAGRTREARRRFLRIAEESTRPAMAQRARYQAAWIADEVGDLEAATKEFGRLRNAGDETIRQESIFRHAIGLFRMQRFSEAVTAFERGQGTGFSSVEKSRHAYWKARALVALGKKAEGGLLLAAVAADPGAGPYALFAARDTGRNPFTMFEARSDGEAGLCGQEKDNLWETIRKGNWNPGDAVKVRRAERLIGLGIVEYAVMEAERVDREAVRKAIGLADGGTAGLFRYLAGDLRGALRETSGVPNDPRTVELIDWIRYPLAPELVGDCDGKVSGVDSLVLHAIIRQESSFQHNALSPAGAVGLMQLMPATAAETARREKMPRPGRNDLIRPEVNVRLGAAYLARLIRSYDGDYLRAVAAYNAGEAAVQRWWDGAGEDPAVFLERISYRETRFYVRSVFFNLLQYYQIYRPEMFARYIPIGPPEGPPGTGAASIPPSEATGAPGAAGAGSPGGVGSSGRTGPPPAGSPPPPAPPGTGR